MPESREPVGAGPRPSSREQIDAFREEMKRRYGDRGRGPEGGDPRGSRDEGRGPAPTGSRDSGKLPKSSRSR
ncbi:MAG: hypothetical protein ACKORI_10940 [Verrucomicrobiota bacterium]